MHKNVEALDPTERLIYRSTVVKYNEFLQDSLRAFKIKSGSNKVDIRERFISEILDSILIQVLDDLSIQRTVPSNGLQRNDLGVSSYSLEHSCKKLFNGAKRARNCEKTTGQVVWGSIELLRMFREPDTTVLKKMWPDPKFGSKKPPAQ